MKQQGDQEFGKLRSFVWPIYANELKKLVPMLIMFFLVCFNYSLLRNLKDAIIVTAKNSGAQVIPFIKVWVMLPAAVLMAFIFTRLSNRYNRQTVFYIIISGFLAFFFIFAYFIYPHREALHPNALADSLSSTLPGGFKWIISVFRNWTFTSFYVIAELWGNIVLTVLFWGFANEITKLSEATRFYSVMSIASNIAATIAGQVGAWLSLQVFDPHFFFGHDAWEQTLAKIIGLIVISGIAIIFTFRWMTKHVLSDPQYIPENIQVKKEKKFKLSLRDSIRYISRSKYLLCIAAIVISYNLVIHLVEIIWKDKLGQLYPDPQHYNAYLNNLTSIMGIISTTASLLMVGIINKLGWTKTALLTPLVLLVTSIAFFICIFGEGTLSPYVSAFFSTTPLALAVFLGSLQNCFSKAGKYSLFDATKEMTFIPLDPEHKLKGKAAIDGIGSRLGKSGGSCIHGGLLLIFTTLSASAPYVAAILLLVVGIWILAVKQLGKKFEQLVDASQDGHEVVDDTLVPSLEKEPQDGKLTPAKASI